MSVGVDGQGIFMGSNDTFVAVRKHVNIPMLRKDF